jgi:hypothetical protein
MRRIAPGPRRLLGPTTAPAAIFVLSGCPSAHGHGGLPCRLCDNPARRITGSAGALECGPPRRTAAFLQRACSRLGRRNRRVLAASKLASRKAAASCRTPKPGFRPARGLHACWPSYHTYSLGGEGGPLSRCTSSGSGSGLRPPKGYGRSGRTARYGPQGDEGLLERSSKPSVKQL